VFAQSKQPLLIGWLHAGSREVNGRLFAAFKEGLAALGWKEGSQVVIEERWADGRSDRLPALAGELAAKGPAVIVAGPVAAAAAATKAAPKTPIVLLSGDPVPAGLVASLAHPGGMVTGVTNVVTDISEKYLECSLPPPPNCGGVGFCLITPSVIIAWFWKRRVAPWRNPQWRRGTPRWPARKKSSLRFRVWRKNAFRRSS